MENPCKKGQQLSKLITRMRTLVSNLDSHDLRVHSTIDEFYYLTKVEELRILIELCENDRKSLESTVELMDRKYLEVFTKWQKDARWLNAYKHHKNRINPCRHNESL